MESEIQFFMTPKDQQEFFEVAEKLLDRITDEKQADGGTIYVFHIGGCVIKFTPSPTDGDILYTGKLTVNTGNIDEHCNEASRTQQVFKKLRNWLKKNYWSRLAYLNIKKKNKLTPSRAYWLGPDAKRWKEKDPDKNILKLSATSWMVFNIGI